MSFNWQENPSVHYNDDRFREKVYNIHKKLERIEDRLDKLEPKDPSTDICMEIIEINDYFIKDFFEAKFFDFPRINPSIKLCQDADKTYSIVINFGNKITDIDSDKQQSKMAGIIEILLQNIGFETEITMY